MIQGKVIDHVHLFRHPRAGSHSIRMVRAGEVLEILSRQIEQDRPAGAQGEFNFFHVKDKAGAEGYVLSAYIQEIPEMKKPEAVEKKLR